MRASNDWLSALQNVQWHHSIREGAVPDAVPPVSVIAINRHPASRQPHATQAALPQRTSHDRLRAVRLDTELQLHIQLLGAVIRANVPGNEAKA